jgi:hypothetical protein
MYLHLGNNILISAQDLISIINIENEITPDLQDIIDIATVEKRIIRISSKDKNKSLIICNKYIYLSSISSTTLYKRTDKYFKGGIK